jgi:hypothetical protein
MDAVVTEEKSEDDAAGSVVSSMDEQIRRWAAEARCDGLQLVGEGGLLARMTKLVVESALDGEMDDHLGYGKHDPAGRDGGNSRNGKRTKTVETEAGPVEIAVPRDRDASFEPQMVKKRQRRLNGVENIVISLSAKGLTTGKISAHLREVYGAEVSKQTISTITDRVMDAMADWQNRPLDSVYPVLFLDCVNVKIRDGNVANRPVYVAMGVTVDGTRDILGLWAGEHGDGEGAKYWLRVLAELKNRGMTDVCIVVCDGLKGLPDAIAQVWPQALVQGCVVHLLRNSFACASPQGLARTGQRPQTRLHRTDGVRRVGPIRRVQRQMGKTISSDRAVMDQRLGRIRAVPAVRPSNQTGHLHHQRHRVGQRSHPPRGQSPRTLPDRGRGAEMRLHGDHEPGPPRHRPATLVQPMESRPERVRDHLRRTPVRRPHVTDSPRGRRRTYT